MAVFKSTLYGFVALVTSRRRVSKGQRLTWWYQEILIRASSSLVLIAVVFVEGFYGECDFQRLSVELGAVKVKQILYFK